MAFKLPQSPFNLKETGAKTSDRTYLDMKPGQYGSVRDLTDDEITAQVKKTGRSSAQIKSEQKKYKSKAKKNQSNTNVTPSSGNQMSQIFSAAGGKGEQEIAKQAKILATGAKNQ
jgi:hypothetical protein